MLWEGFLIGLSMGVFCLGWCLPAFLPYLLSEKRDLKQSFKILGKFLGGRFIAYLMVGALMGFLGEEIQSPWVFQISFWALLILGIFLIFYGLGKLGFPFASCRLFQKIKVPWVLGFLLGFNLCPPFVAALLYAFSLQSQLSSILFFLAFFLGTSVYLVFPAFLGFLSLRQVLQKISRLACILSGGWFLFFSVKNLFFSAPLLNFGARPCFFLDFYSPFLNYPWEIFLLVLAVGMGVFAFIRKKYFYLRYLTLFLFFLLALFKFPQFCPYLTLQEAGLGRFSNFFALLFFLLILTSALVVGRFFCGWACPILFFQEMIHPISKRIKKIPKLILPPKLIYLKFLILILVLISVYILKETVFCGKDPFGALFGFFRNPISLSLLFVLFLLSIFVYLPFCRYFCPLGAVLALLSKISIFKFKPGQKRTCQIGAISDNKIDDSECIRCGECFR